MNSAPSRIRIGFWLTSVAMSIACGALYSAITQQFDEPSIGRVFIFAALGVMMTATMLLSPKSDTVRRSILIIWIPAILARMVFIPTAPSDDINRYLWEGKLVSHDVSPYETTADSDSWTSLRDGYWEGMNHKDKLTAYPPVVLFLFTAIGQLWYHPLALKLFFILADLLTLAGIIMILRRRGLSPNYAIFYSLNPIVLVAYAGEAHFDSLMVAPLIWTIWAFEKKRNKLSIALLSFASAIKWVTLPLFPFLIAGALRNKPAKVTETKPEPGASVYQSIVIYAIIPIVILIGPALYFWTTLPQLVQGLLEFGSTRSFNGPIYYLIHNTFQLDRITANLIVGSLWLLIYAWRWIYHKAQSLDAHFCWILGSLIILSPTVHFWYLTWILPFVCLRPTLPWIVLSVTTASYFFVWHNQAHTDHWGLSPWQLQLLWCPFFLSIIYECWSQKLQFLNLKSPNPIEEPTVGIVIPTLNAQTLLPKALKSIARQSVLPDSIIVVDGGSSDQTRSIVETNQIPAKWLEAKAGRGNQIAYGINHLHTDWALVLHADVELDFESIAQLKQATMTHPRMIGGALGQRFSGHVPELLPIEVLNDFRALFTRTAFGDQVQFFRKDITCVKNLMPSQPLMEDVESSWRLRTRGDFVFLNQPCLVSHQKWQSNRWFTRVKLVLNLMFRYRWARRKGETSAAAISEKLYKEYYR
ncbi:glycosyltransferase [Rubellicoccus peritrichatus]|uniref:Glycosyltransferase n=1 Tax=Rubellicoccus peritrichatus TaxID=3080537 RepID=A0AAQ3LA68_9BACT|nr:glycosyltransferase [Puniceicoccus sp. CR14]WOO39733.1 glycosyltransferase [Puniceicoccus sp. CR14]